MRGTSPARPGPAWMVRGVGGPERRHAPGAGLLGGWWWKYHLSLPSRPFLPLVSRRSRPYPRPVASPSAVFFSLLRYSMTLGDPNPRAHPPRAPDSAFPGTPSHLPAFRVPPLRLSPESRKTRPLPPSP